jgi:hypothetical protein
MELLSELWNALPSPVALAGDLAQGLSSMSLWLKEDYHGIVVILALTGIAFSWIALRRR